MEKALFHPTPILLLTPLPTILLQLDIKTRQRKIQVHTDMIHDIHLASHFYLSRISTGVDTDGSIAQHLHQNDSDFSNFLVVMSQFIFPVVLIPTDTFSVNFLLSLLDAFMVFVFFGSRLSILFLAYTRLTEIQCSMYGSLNPSHSQTNISFIQID